MICGKPLGQMGDIDDVTDTDQTPYVVMMSTPQNLAENIIQLLTSLKNNDKYHSQTHLLL